MIHPDKEALMKDANIQAAYQSVMIRGMGAMLEVMAMLLEDAERE